MCFIDDINMSEVEKFGNQSACEFIRQHLDCEGVFDPESMKWRHLSKTQYVTTVNPTLSQNKLSPRFLRHFMLFNCPYPRFVCLVPLFNSMNDLQFVQFVMQRVLFGGCFSNSEVHTIFKSLLMNHFLPPDLTAPVGTTMSSYKYNQEKLEHE